MNTMKTLFDLTTLYNLFFKIQNKFGLCDRMPDDEYLKKLYRIRMGKELNLEEPKTYNEKLQWLKLYDRRKEYSTMVDKYLVKDYVANIIGKEYIIPTLGVWERFEDINFHELPNRFVLKCTHDSGGLVICKGKDSFDIDMASKIIKNSLKNNYYFHGREWPYKNVSPRIIAEEYMEDETNKGELTDYKFFCFNGKVKMMFIATDRQNPVTDTKFDFFDENFIHLPFKQGHPNANKVLNKPFNFKEMKVLAEKLSKNIPHIRVDFYEINKKIYFGELTFFHFCGLEPIIPNEWDYRIGKWLKLPQNTLN